MQSVTARSRRREAGATRRGRAVLGAAAVVVLVGALAIPAGVAAGLLAGGDSEQSLSTTPAVSAPGAPAPSPSGSPARASSSPSPSPSPVPLAGSTPAPDEVVVRAGDGELEVVPGTAPPAGDGEVLRYLVEVEGGLGVDPQRFAAAVHRILTDPRGWGSDGDRAFQRVDEGPVDFRVALASPETTDRLCRPLDTAGIFSCEVGGRAALNSARWLQGADAYGDDVESYREYLVSHEVGHALDYRHVYSCLPDGRAHVMQQQTKSLAGCTQNPWPDPDAG